MENAQLLGDPSTDEPSAQHGAMARLGLPAFWQYKHPHGPAADARTRPRRGRAGVNNVQLRLAPNYYYYGSES